MPKKQKIQPITGDIEKKFYSRLLLVLIIIAAATAVYMLWPRSGHGKTSPAPSNEMVLNVMPLLPREVTFSNQYIGYVTPIKSVEVVPQISGYLETVWVEGGQEVLAGDNLILIQPDEYKARLDAAIASVTQAQADFNNASVYYQRIKKAGAKAVSKTEIDNAKAKYLAAQGALSQAKADRELARVNYDYTLLQAPIDGIVGNVDLTRGNYVSPASQPLLKIIQYDPIRVVFSITDKEYLDETARNRERLFAGENIRLKLAGGLQYPYNGEFRFTANEIDRATNSIAVYADFPNPDKILVANAYVDILVERTMPDAYVVKQNLVTMDASGNYIYTVRGSKLYKTPVKIVASLDDGYVLGNRFAKDEYLVLDKVGRLPENVKIKLNVVSPSAKAKENK